MNRKLTDQLDDYYLNNCIDELTDLIMDEKLIDKDNRQVFLNRLDDIKRELDNIMDNAYRFGETLESIKLEVDDLE